MKVQRVIGPLEATTHIIIEDVDQLIARDSDLWFWKTIDKAAAEMGVRPFCACMERPHRMFCPLGFDNYFPHEVEEAQKAEEEF